MTTAPRKIRHTCIVIGHCARFNAQRASNMSRLSTKIVTAHLNGWLLVSINSGQVRTIPCPVDKVGPAKREDEECIIYTEDGIPPIEHELQVVRNIARRYPLGSEQELFEKIFTHDGGRTSSRYELLNRHNPEAAIRPENVRPANITPPISPPATPEVPEAEVWADAGMTPEA